MRLERKEVGSSEAERKYLHQELGPIDAEMASLLISSFPAHPPLLPGNSSFYAWRLLLLRLFMSSWRRSVQALGVVPSSIAACSPNEDAASRVAPATLFASRLTVRISGS